MLTLDDKLKINVGDSLIDNEITAKLFGMTVGNRSSFGPHFNTVCKKVNPKLHALVRISNYICQLNFRE